MSSLFGYTLHPVRGISPRALCRAGACQGPAPGRRPGHPVAGPRERMGNAAQNLWRIRFWSKPRLQVRHLLQESALTFVRFHENAFLCAFKAVFRKKTLAFLCKKWYVVSQRNALDTRILLSPAGRRPAAFRANVAIFFIYLLIIYPACPQGQKTAAQPARAAVFVLFFLQTVFYK